MAAVNHSKTMSSLLFYHKKEKTLSHHRDRVWAGFKRFCSEFLISSLREESATNELASPRMGKHQYFHVPTHVARRHCLAGSIDEPERRPLGRSIALGFLIAGWRTRRGSNPLINRYSIFTTKRRDFSRIMSFDSFPDYRSANQAEGGQTPSADAESAVSGSHKPRLPKKKTTSGASWDGRSDRWLRFPRPACPEPSRTDGPEWTFRRRF